MIELCELCNILCALCVKKRVLIKRKVRKPACRQGRECAKNLTTAGRRQEFSVVDVEQTLQPGQSEIYSKI